MIIIYYLDSLFSKFDKRELPGKDGARLPHRRPSGRTLCLVRSRARVISEAREAVPTGELFAAFY